MHNIEKVAKYKWNLKNKSKLFQPDENVGYNAPDKNIQHNNQHSNGSPFVFFCTLSYYFLYRFLGVLNEINQ